MNSIRKTSGTFPERSNCINTDFLPKIARDLILDSFNNRIDSLVLGDLNLSSIPAEIGNLTHLTELALFSNQLTTLPDSIGKLTQLTGLTLFSNQLTALPDSIGNLTQLTQLALFSNQLTALPDSIGNLTQLTEFDLSSNLLANLPNSIENLTQLTILDVYNNHLTALPDSIGSLTQLTKLTLTNNRLTALPDSIGSLTQLTEFDLSSNLLANLPNSIENLTQLTILDVYNNHLTALPDSIGSLTQLTKLTLTNNRLTALPDSVGNLTQLTMLNLSCNQLTSLPNGILQLPSSCTVMLSNNPLPQNVLHQLREAINASDYNGPIIHFSIDESQRTTISTEEALRELFQIAMLTPFEIPQPISKNKNFNHWLNKLSFTADYRRGGQTQKKMAQLTIKYIQLMANDESFQETFLAILTQSNQSCSDRVAYYFILLGDAYRLHTMSFKNPQTVAKYLINTCWAIDQLREVAESKVKTLRFVDEIEVYLAYPIKLQKRLEMELNVQEMLHFSWSVSERELEDAAEFVLTHRNNEESRMKYLTNHPKWIEVLTKRFGPSEDLDEYDDWFDQNILDDSKRLELTQKLLSNS